MQGFAFSTGLAAILGMSLFRGCHAPQQSHPHQVFVPAADQQVARGQVVYSQQCAACHGAAGQGTADAPALVGAGALARVPRADSARQSEFRTALDVAQFVTQNMPPDPERRQAIAEQDYWAILAFALSANGVVLQQPVTAQNAQQIVLRP